VWWLHALVRLTTVVVTTAVLDMGGRTGAVATTTVAPDARRTRMALTTVGLDVGPTFTALTAVDLVAVNVADLLALGTAGRIMWRIGVTGRLGLRGAPMYGVAPVVDREPAGMRLRTMQVGRRRVAAMSFMRVVPVPVVRRLVAATRLMRAVPVDRGPVAEMSFTQVVPVVPVPVLMVGLTASRRTLPGETTGRRGLVARRFMVATAADRARAGALAAVLAEGPERVAQVALPAGALAAGPERVVLAAGTTSSLT
jgi:hypothetical protein